MKMQEINGIKIYTVTDRVLYGWNLHEATVPVATKEDLSKILSVLIKNTPIVSENRNNHNKKRYIFGDIKMDVNQNDREVYFLRIERTGIEVPSHIKKRVLLLISDLGVEYKGDLIVADSNKTVNKFGKWVASIAAKDNNLFDAIAELDNRMFRHILKTKYGTECNLNLVEIYSIVDMELTAYS